MDPLLGPGALDLRFLGESARVGKATWARNSPSFKLGIAQLHSHLLIMSSGRTHDRITLASCPLLTGLAGLSTQSGIQALLFGSSFLFSGLMFGPDLDIYSRPYQRWGLLRWIWLPYRRVTHHRSMLSHGPIVGTSFRLLYLSTWLFASLVLAVVCWAQLRAPEDWQTVGLSQLELLLRQLRQLVVDHPDRSLMLFLGLELGAMSHSCVDWGSSALKRWRKGRSKSSAGRHKRS